ncbi:adenosylcobalamin-dependent ribonucleoside-diphosphate reductase [Haloarchaeobius sp. HRN-SO-5]|uniref:adenosylcobalamin-dependent ribonucleoside-diphosphate reductase n=1 Tax=Haloarchaeobius sp. HRN-SO-5 TaxID=3446118 RepID=UPI003EBB5D63
MTDEMDFVLPVKRVRGDTLAERLSSNAYERILPARYLRKDADGEVVETPEGMFERVATAVAAAERESGGDAASWESRFYESMTGLEFMPNSPTLMNAGAGTGQLAACFVMSPSDSLRSIFETLGQAATVMQSGGGVGYSFTDLRPRGDLVRSTGGVASGPVSFMRVYDTMCEQIRQGGRRRGAQMGVLHVDHPDVGRFCTAKRDEGVLANFNISVGVTDEFYSAVQEGGRYRLVNPQSDDQHVVTEATAQFYSTAYEDELPSAVESNFWRDYADDVPGIDQFRGETDLDVGDDMTLPARFVWALVVDGAWQNGEPGLFMLDETNRDHSFDVERHPDHRIEATNPCGEQGLEEYEACTLGHVNLSLLAEDDVTPWPAFVDAPDVDATDLPATVDAFLDQAVDWDRLTRVVHTGTRFLDDVVTVSRFPVDEITETVTDMRKVGLGIMGLAELLIQFGVRYGTPASVEIADRLMAHVNRESTLASHELATERGVFPAWDESRYADPTANADWFERHTGLDASDWSDGFPIRNHSTTSIAPCGTTGMIANTSGGCEPLFNVVYFKNVGRDVQGDEALVEFDDYFHRTVEANGLEPDALREQALSLMQTGTFHGPADLSIPDGLAELFVTAGEIPAESHVRMQAALQRHVDGAISKTVNLPNDATRADVADAFSLAVELGCKGVTVYRDRSRREQVMTTRPAESTGAGSRPQEARCCPVWIED